MADGTVFTFKKDVLEKYSDLRINKDFGMIADSDSTDVATISNQNAQLRIEEFSHHKPDIIRLNNGSFGACPKSVMEVCNTLRQEWFENPDNYWHTLDYRFNEASSAVAEHLLKDKTASKDVYVVDNLTVAFSILANSIIARISSENSAILTQAYTYDAVKIATVAACKNAPVNHGLSDTAVEPVITDYIHYKKIAVGKLTVIEIKIPFPILDAHTHDDILTNAYVNALNEVSAMNPALVIELAIVDHITSVPSILMPIESIIPYLRSGSVPVKEILIDGAHTPGILNLDHVTSTLGADYYIANLHKWCLAPTTCAFLYISSHNDTDGSTQKDLHHFHHPIVSHSYGTSLQKEVSMLGTKDYSALNTVPAIFQFISKRFGSLENYRTRNKVLCYEAGLLLATAWNTVKYLTPKEHATSMIMVGLPSALGDTHEAGESIRIKLRDLSMSNSIHGIIIQKLYPVFGDRLYLRLSFGCYNTLEEVSVLKDAINSML